MIQYRFTYIGSNKSCHIYKLLSNEFKNMLIKHAFDEVNNDSYG